MSGQSADSPVIVVGAGPVGMATGLLLAKQGVPSVILERRTTPSCDQSRAVTVQRDILALYDRLGFVDEVLAEGAGWSVGRTFVGDRELMQLQFPTHGQEVYPAFVNFPQFRTEQILHSAAEATGLVHFRHGHVFQALEQRHDHVELRVATPDGTQQTHTARYVVAADGLGSWVRKQLGIAFHGWRSSGRFLVCDFAAELPFARERRLWFGPSFYAGGIVLMHSIGHNLWRIDWQIDPGAEESQYLDPQRLGQLLHDAVGDHAVQVLRANTYTFQQRRAERFRSGRVFLAGDAAHVVSPFGARGMNSGMEDAENLAWKLAYVLSGRADERLLDSYHEERSAAAAHHVAVTGATMNFMTPPTREGLARRDAILQAAATDRASLARVDSGKLYEPFPYHDSPLTGCLDAVGDPVSGSAVDDAVAVGNLAPDGHCHTAEGPTTLRRLLGGEVSVLAVPAAGSSSQPLLRRLARVAAVPPNRIFLLSTEELEADSAGPRLITDAGGLLVAAYAGEADRLFFVRPDCYLGVRTPVPETAEATAHLADQALSLLLGRRPVVDAQATHVREELGARSES
ncbi:FAD-dependent monooxygenase [Streptomyces sp. NPDC085932]|uniref:FAD-dependent monooxygenase n=1 Tax=Streptomyces sp. NPDC085932 TaxID=3365741 RepID=UPI0037CCDFDA